jgi:hypothetical protein
MPAYQPRHFPTPVLPVHPAEPDRRSSGQFRSGEVDPSTDLAIGWFICRLGSVIDFHIFQRGHTTVYFSF